MATLTTSWKSYASASYSNGTATITFYLEAKYSSQSIANNTTNVQTRLRSAFTKGNSLRGAGYKFTCSYASTKSGSGVWAFEDEVILSGSSTITHTASGTKTISLSATAHNDYWNFTKSLSASVTLPTIPRSATITSAPNFTDEDNPTIRYSNPAGNNVTTLQASIYMPDALTGLALYRNISKTGSSYTFNLTEEERERLRLNCVNSKSTTVRFYIMTVLGGTTYRQYLAKTLTIIDANPTFNATYEDTNASSIAITQNNQLLIQNQSTLQINITNATTYKNATLSSIKATINGVTYNGTLDGSNGTINVGALNIAENTDAIVTLTDSRGYTATQTLNLQFLGWQLPTANITLQRQNNYYSETDIKVDANYSNLDNKNTITIQVREKKQTDSTWSSYTTLQDNVSSTLTLDNKFEWDVQVVITDRLGSTTYNLTLDKGMPIIYFDRLKRSVGVNCFPNDDESLELQYEEEQYNVGELFSKNDFICCSTNSAQTLTTTGETNVKFDRIISQKGTGFTLSNYQITCNFDGFIEVSGQVQYSNARNTQAHNVQIYNNSTVITRSLNSSYTNSSNKSAIAGTVIVPVSEGDIIKMSVYAVSGEELNPGGNGTHITIKRVG